MYDPNKVAAEIYNQVDRRATNNLINPQHVKRTIYSGASSRRILKL